MEENNQLREILETVDSGENIILHGPGGTGKCLDPETPILMFDGSVKIIKNVELGDQIMGDDSFPRRVLSICNGEDKMYCIETPEGDSFIANSAHILTLCYKKEIVDISIQDYIRKPKRWKQKYKLFKIRVKFPKNRYDPPTTPYHFGLWSGGSKYDDPEVKLWEKKYYASTGKFLTKEKDLSDDHFSAVGVHYFLHVLGSTDIFTQNSIPKKYLLSSRKSRLELLAGLIDSGGTFEDNKYKINPMNHKIINDIVFLARSLGYYAYSCIEKGQEAVEIYGNNFDVIPIISKNKKACSNEKTKKRIFFDLKITSLGKGSYCGFTLDRNGRFVLGNFIVTHNTYTLCSIAKHLRLVRKKNVYCTATTGVAAINLNIPECGISASTLHNWAGVFLGREEAPVLYARVYNNKRKKKKWLCANTLIIDEISMLGSVFLDKLDYIGRKIRKNNKPFGGIQLILSGDVLQLPPVKDNWCFKSKMWKELNLVPFVFKDPKRYDDEAYFELLLRAREGKCTDSDMKKLRARVRAYNKFNDVLSGIESINVVKPTILYSRKMDVESYNEKELEKLPGIAIEYLAIDFFAANIPRAKKERYNQILDDSIAKRISLKIGAQVMLKINLDVENGLVNGSRGVVLDLNLSHVYVRFINGVTTGVDLHTWTIENKKGVAASRTQIPFILAWALTIHKCVSEKTLLSTEHGIIPIGNLSDSDGWSPKQIQVSTLMGREETSQIFKGEVEESIIIETDMGYFLEGSRRHPILIKTREGEEVWKILPDVKEKDLVVLKIGQKWKRDNVTHPNLGEITPDIAYIFGLIVGSGSYDTDGVIDIKNNNSSLLDFLEDELEILASDKIRPHGKKLLFTDERFREILLELGFDYAIESNKKIPWCVMKSSQESQKSFLRGLFDAKGFLRRSCVWISFYSKVLAEEVHILLLSLGIISKRKSIPHGFNKLWRIKIVKNNLYKYLETIGSFFNKNFPACEKDPPNECRNNYFYDKIKRIETGKCQMYDLEVPGSHSFISNGIVSHNSQGCTLDYAICDVGTRVFANGQAYVALSRVRNLKGLFISEFYPPAIQADKKALKYAKSLENQNAETLSDNFLYQIKFDSDEDLEN